MYKAAKNKVGDHSIQSITRFKETLLSTILQIY